jgi:hypothetical protein
MELIDKQAAADLMDIPVVWLNGMVEQGKLVAHKDVNGFELIDKDDIVVKRYASKELEAPSMAHVQSMLKKILGK